MTRRDPRLPASDPALQAEASQPDLLGKGRVRDPTQSLSIDPVDSEVTDGPLPLALGTHEAEPSTDRATKLETPGARGRTQAPVRAVTATRPPPIPRATDDPEHRLGSVLGSYRVEELLGKGGMGYVYRAEHIRLGREVALKLLRSDYARRRDSVARFFQEARTVNRVRHRNIVDVTAHYRHLRSGLTLRLTVKNALDDVYIVARRPEGIFTSGFRQILLGLRWDYEKTLVPAQ